MNDAMTMKKLMATGTIGLVLGLAMQANAVSYVLHSSSADNLDAQGGANNPHGNLYEAGGVSSGSGTEAVDLGGYSNTQGGNASTGFWAKISFDGNPQPNLTGAFIKSATRKLVWDAADLAAFNSGTFDSITLWNDDPNGIKNQNNQFQGTSHFGLNGTSVPDGGSTLVLLGAALAGLGFARRKLVN